MRFYGYLFLFLSFLLVYSEYSELLISESRFRDNIKILSSDEFEGRKPGTDGGKKTIRYIEAEFKQAGLLAGNGDDYQQFVDLVEVKTELSNISVSLSGNSTTVDHGGEVLTFARSPLAQLSITDSDIVFVGYGVVAPEYNWDDYQGVDVAGKTVIILSNDPGYLSGSKDRFLGRGVTYYAKDTYKYEEAARQGASAAFIIHDSSLLSTNWSEHVNKNNSERSMLSTEKAGSVSIQGYISASYAAELFASSGRSYKHEMKAALSNSYKPKPLNASISINLVSSLKPVTSSNVVGIIPGNERPNEYIVYLAHWDHLGRDKSLEGDEIYNGARDNAAGIASLIELAYLFKAEPPKRSVVIMAVTAEESGLLGSYHYVQEPLYPLAKTVGAINLDMMNLSGKTTDVLVHGLNNSSLMDDAIREAIAIKQGRIAKPFGRLEAGIAYRNDGFSFNRSGVPTIGLASGSEHIEYGSEWMEAQADDYFEHNYHQVTDEYSENIDVSGALLDVMALYLVGTELSNSVKFAQWYDGKEFKHLRDAQLMSDQTTN